ncbi:unnamed protein product [Oikopleura dioica]|uniref:Uncharacterized protein n=1 Tax=Oikopleura dioica TaxID=34765 RepID=E4YX15_OIKDI|nr:unnamed protein product [Oikopleura dioica]
MDRSSRMVQGNKSVSNRRMSLAFQKRDSVMGGASLHRATQLGYNASIASIRRNQKESSQRLKTRQELAYEQRLKAEAKLPKCQPWRLPKYSEKIIYAGKKSTTIQKLEGFETFCPACNVAFADHYEYQSHLILRERAKPYEEGLRDVAKQIKEQSERLVRSESNTESFKIIRKSIFKIPGNFPRRRRGFDISNYMSHLGELRARVATTEKLNYKSDSENFRFNTGLKGTQKKFFSADHAFYEMKKTKMKYDSFKNETRVRQIMHTHKGASVSKLIPERSTVPLAERTYKDPSFNSGTSLTPSKGSKETHWLALKSFLHKTHFK